jgi:hypothetical protein
MLDLKSDETYVQIQWNPNKEQWETNWCYRYPTRNPYDSGRLEKVVLQPVQGGKSSEKFKDRWDVVRGWIQGCNESHTRCRPLDKEERYILPKRLIYTGLRGGDVSLCLGEELSPVTQYLTLFHCWGKSVPLKLLKDNFHNLRNQIPVAKLSKNLKLSLHIAHQLGFAYIWIDSLW